MSDNVSQFYQSIGFEEIETDDGQMVLGIEFTSEEQYALLTDTEGKMPKNLTQEIIFACYTADDAFQWSTSFKNSTAFKELWLQEQTSKERLTAITKHREANQRF